MLNLAQKTCPPFSTFGLGVRDIFVRRSLWSYCALHLDCDGDAEGPAIGSCGQDYILCSVLGRALVVVCREGGACSVAVEGVSGM